MSSNSHYVDYWDYGPYPIENSADWDYRRNINTGEVQWYDDATREWITVSKDKWPYRERNT
jgi:hypothetical protein